ncbi:MAG: hypothetical protein SCK29_05270 [Bacillota bacterium]|nr:hypothetical protein [Bacillota bacterium]MDW7683513.1 hypothetical protein [Bacillota bacterium]
MGKKNFLRENNYHVDAALARPCSPDLINSKIVGIESVAGMALPEIGLVVKKSGRTTGYTTGRITTTGTVVSVGYGSGRKARLTNQIVTTRMGEPGDSGSLLLDTAGRAVGLLFAGSTKTTLYNPIQDVLESLSVRLADKDMKLPEYAGADFRLRRFCETQAEHIFTYPNVVGVGIGHKFTGGIDTGLLCLSVLVERKLPLSQLRGTQLLPSRLAGMPLDVVETGRLTADTAAKPQDRKIKMRPARPGMSIAHHRVSAGTFGAVVYDVHDGEPLILSNNHVLANGTDGTDGLAAEGDPILQPGPRDGGREPDDIIATLHRFYPLYFD